MSRNFLMVEPTEMNTKIAELIRSRELELMSYDFEAAAHQAAIDALGPIQWDDTTLKYKGLARDVMIARALADGLTGDQITAISNLLALDYHTLNLHAVAIETAKSERHYDNLLATLPAGPDRDTAIATVQTAIASTAPDKLAAAVKG